MEQYFKFIFYAVLFVIYVVSQIYKAKKKAEEKKALRPEEIPTQEVKPKPVASNTNYNYKGQREMKRKEKKQISFPQEKERQPIVYKPVADEELIAEAALLERRKEQKALKGERQVLMNEHLDSYVDQTKKSNMNLDWLKDKTNLKRTFIAAEIFQRKYQ